nr:translation initiation factor IF-2-like [Manis javanica]
MEDWVGISATLDILSLKNIQEERFNRQLEVQDRRLGEVRGPPLYAVWRLTSSGRARPPFVSPFSSVLVSRFLPRAAALVCAVPSDLSSTDKFDLRGHDRGGGQGRPRRQGPGRERASRRVALGVRFRRGAGAPRVPPSCRGGRAGEGKGSVPEAPPTAGFRALAVGVEERRQEKRTEGRSRPGGSREAGGAGGRAPDRRFSTLAAQQHPREPWQVPTPGPPQLTSYPGVSRAGARPGNRSAENHCPPTLGFSDFFPCQLIPLTARWCPLPGKSFCCSRHRLNNPFSL